MIVRFLQIEGGDVEAYLSILDTLNRRLEKSFTGLHFIIVAAKHIRALQVCGSASDLIALVRALAIGPYHIFSWYSFFYFICNSHLYIF